MIKIENTHYKEIKLEPGDTVVCKGIKATIAKITFQEWYDDYGFITEFTDTNGVYRSWKQGVDGGYVIEKSN